MKQPLILLVFLCAMMSGCATIMSSNTTVTQIETVPSRVQCTLEGSHYRYGITTPTQVTLHAKAAPVTVTCTAPGYFPAIEDLDTYMDGWSFGNILAGGILGSVVDIATNSGKRYPPYVLIIMDKDSFPSAKDRDAWYNQREKELNEMFDNLIQKIEQLNAGDISEEEHDLYRLRISRLNERREVRLATIRSHRAASGIQGQK